MATRPYCFVLSSKQSDGHYYVGVAIQDKPGYLLTNWDYGTDHNHAQASVDTLNERRGIEAKAVVEIVASSMQAQNARIG